MASAMMEVLGRVNEGYKVFMAYAYDDNTGVVIAKKDGAPEGYVVWSFSFFDGGVSFYWGHYTNDKEEAMKQMRVRMGRNENS